MRSPIIKLIITQSYNCLQFSGNLYRKLPPVEETEEFGGKSFALNGRPLLSHFGVWIMCPICLASYAKDLFKRFFNELRYVTFTTFAGKYVHAVTTVLL